MDTRGDGRGRELAADGWAPPSAHRTRAEAVEGYSDLVEVGRGGDSVVYRGHEDRLARDVAIKVLLVDDEPTRERFRRELALTVQLGRAHPNIVTVLDTATTGSGRPCIVMDFFDLGSLHDRLRRQGPLPVDDVVAVGTVIADALAYAHAQGVLHRDVKPSNILVLPTSYVLADFGIARLDDADHTGSAERFSYRHASPQVLDGYRPTAADDIWSLGSTLHTLLDGRPPFASDDPNDDSALAYLRRVRTEQPRPLARDDVPDELRTVLDRCLSKTPEDRYASADDLRRALSGLRTEARDWAPAAGPDVEADSGDGSTDGSGHEPAGASAPSHAPVPPPAPVRPAAGSAWAPSPAVASVPEADPTGPAPVSAAHTVALGNDEAERSQAPAAHAATATATQTPVAPVTPPVAPVPPASTEPTVHAAAVDTRRKRQVVSDDRDDSRTGDDTATGIPNLVPEVVEDDQATGTGPRAPGHRGARRRADPRQRRVVVILALVALIAGLAIGGAGFYIRHRDELARQQADTTPTAPPQSQVPVEQESTGSAASVTPTGPALSDPAYAARIIDLQDRGSQIVLNWTDPTKGKASFIVVNSRTRQAYVSTAVGVAKATVSVRPGQRPLCFVVTTLVGGQLKAASLERCTAS